MHFGLRGCKVHRHRMCWKLKETADGKEYLEFNERKTKTRSGSDRRDIKVMPRKMFATDGLEKVATGLSKLYAHKRPEKMNEDDSPFYLAVNRQQLRGRVASDESGSRLVLLA